MPKSPSFTYVQLRDFIEDATDRKTVSAVLIIALDHWKKKSISDHLFSCLLKDAADRVQHFN